MSEASDERYTPEWVLDVVRDFGDGLIGLDPCADPANRTKALTWFSLPDDGLKSMWAPVRGVAFVNPPYSRGELIRWMRKCQVEAGMGVEVVALIPSDLGTEAGALVARGCDALCFIRGRIAFLGPDGATLPCGAKQPSVIAYWGERAKRFHRVFSQIGTVWPR